GRRERGARRRRARGRPRAALASARGRGAALAAARRSTRAGAERGDLVITLFTRTHARASLIDARVKVIALLTVSVLLVVLERPLPLALLALATFVTLIATRPSLRALVLLLVLTALGVWGTMLGQAIFYAEFPRTPVVTLVRPETPLIGPLTGGIA